MSFLYSTVSYLYVSCTGSITSVGEESYCLLVNSLDSVRRGFLFLLVRVIGCVILLWHVLPGPSI